MMKFKKSVLMLCLTLSVAFSYAHGMARTENEKGGTSKIAIMKAHYGSTEKSSSIQANIDGHTLTVTFAENLGHVQVQITTASGTPVDGMTIYTPNGIVRYIPNVGDYIVTFTLANGDEYYGEFTVTD